MNVRLTHRQREFVKRQVAEGRYASASEVIREGIRLLAAETAWKGDVRRKVAKGLAQVRIGRVVDGERAVQKVLANLKKRKVSSRRTVRRARGE